MKWLIPALILALPALAKEKTHHAVESVQTVAESFLESLEDDKRAKAIFPFTSEERENWHYTPTERKGLSLKEMNDTQKNEAVAMVTALLSERGAYQTAQIILLESVLAALEQNPEFRDVENYYVSIFGIPGDPAGWGLRFEGHHLSLNLTIADQGRNVAVTPCFMGANPEEVMEGQHQGMRPLSAEEDLARALAVSLLEAGKKDVVFSEKAPREIITREERKVTAPEAVGITLEALSENQQKALFELIQQFTHRFQPEFAEPELAAMRKQKLHFGWAGGTGADDAYYYRIQGDGFLIETANTQNNAKHIHTVWRDFNGDFGRDLLKEHVEDQH